MKMSKTSEKRFQCNICAKNFTFKYLLGNHYRIHTGEKPYHCVICGNKFSQKTNLQLHMVGVHHNRDFDSLYICFHCNKPFYLKNNLKQHIRIHTGAKPYKCSVCCKRFRRPCLLSQHQRVHLKTRPFICALCNRSFTNRTNLLNHLKRHQGKRDFVCEKCGKAFVRQDGLRKHLDCFHRNEKAFTCDVCHGSFKGHLRQHKRIHEQEKPYKCNKCESSFIQKSQLTVHLRTHSGDKPYLCPICEANFSHSSVLKIHIRVHTGEKPFKCMVCNNTAFGQLAHLRKHMRTIHKSDAPYCCTICKIYFKGKKAFSQHTDQCHNHKLHDNDSENEGRLDISSMRTLLAILLKRISTQERLDKLGFGKRLIDDVLRETIISSGRRPYNTEDFCETVVLLKNIEILLDWTIPKIHMAKLKQAKRTTEDILIKLTQDPKSWN